MSFNTYYQPNSDPNDQQNPVSHYVEFKNATAFPWTTGVVNILSQQNGHSYPISQDKLGYTPSAVKCKVRVAQTPEIKVTHGEGDIERKENVRRFFSQTYDEITVEGEVCVVNHKDKPVTVKVLRSIEGAPVSSDRSWKTQQEQATLRVNSRFDVEWDLDLKAGEEQKWKYRYKVYVRL